MMGSYDGKRVVIVGGTSGIGLATAKLLLDRWPASLSPGARRPLVVRYRRAVGEQRQQIKWMAFAAVVVVLIYLAVMVSSSVSPSSAWFSAGSAWWTDLLAYAALVSFVAIPIAVGFAVLKYRLYEIDLVINRALVYAPLNATLARAYFGSVVVLQSLLRALTGGESRLAIVAFTVAIAALFDPLERRMQAFVDRRFCRRKYDAAKTLEAFSARLREETDLGVLSEHLVGVVGETMRPSHVSLWLAPEAAPKVEQSGHP